MQALIPHCCLLPASYGQRSLSIRDATIFSLMFSSLSLYHISIIIVGFFHYIFSISLEYTCSTNHGSVDFFSASSGENQATPLFSSDFMETASSESASSRYVTFKCKWLDTYFPFFTCPSTVRDSKEKISSDTGLTWEIPASSFTSRRATASKSVSPSACPPSQDQEL